MYASCSNKSSALRQGFLGSHGFLGWFGLCFDADYLDDLSLSPNSVVSVKLEMEQERVID